MEKEVSIEILSKVVLILLKRWLMFTQQKCYHTFTETWSCLCDFHIITMFGTSLSPVVCRRAHVLFMLFVFVWYSGVTGSNVLSYYMSLRS